MEQNNPSSKSIKVKLKAVSKKMSLFLRRWFFMILLVAAAIFCILVWYRLIWKADWSEAKKQSYINEQAKFSFDKTNYQKIVEMMKSRKEKLENFPSFAGRDIFFPEGF